MEHIVKIRIAKDFSRVPAGRYYSDGPFSGERFRKEKLEPPLLNGDRVEVIFDGARGYGSSFLEEAFGGLVRDKVIPAAQVLDRITLVSDDDPSIVTEVRAYIAKQVASIHG